jgi:hypothetical protein
MVGAANIIERQIKFGVTPAYAQVSGAQKRLIFQAGL